MAVTAKTARGAARKPGGASRRHAQVVLYFQEGSQDKPMPIQLRHETPDDIAAIEAVTIAAFTDAPHTSHTEQFIVPPGYFMALALHGPVPEGIAQYSDAFNAAA